MGLSTYSNLGPRRTPQSEPIPGSGQVENRAGGHAWAVDIWTQLERFLILGSEGGTYYVSQRKLSVQNAGVVRACLAEDPARTVATIVEISKSGRAPKNLPAIFALAAAAGEPGPARTAALAALPAVCRIPTHLFQFCELLKSWTKLQGRAIRSALGRWYTQRDVERLAYHLIKYRQREGWTHRDVLRLAHPKPQSSEQDRLFRWAAGKCRPADEGLPAQVEAFRLLQSEGVTARQAASIITEHRMPRECVPTRLLNDASVWDALSQDMPTGALVRNLGKMTAVGLLKPMSAAVQRVTADLRCGDRILAARVHPISLLIASKIYAQGRGDRGSLTWEPVPAVVDALEHAFYTAFRSIKPTGKRTLIALDISGSMDWGTPCAAGLSARVVSAAMSMAVARSEPVHHFVGFSHTMIPLGISARQRLADVVRTVSGLPFGGTDCALPMQWAAQNKVDVDTFVIYTDSETWFGAIHPAQALRAYRQRTGIGAKLVVCGVTADKFSIADPADRGMLDVVGFDASCPAVIADFARS